LPKAQQSKGLLQYCAALLVWSIELCGAVLKKGCHGRSKKDSSSLFPAKRGGVTLHTAPEICLHHNRNRELEKLG
jgi:hypothetical protein